jgi:endoribonuclease Dicer
LREKSGLGSSAVETLPSFVPYNLLTQHSIPDKSIADAVEALIGAYLIACGPQGALLFMTWLGLTVLPQAGDSCSNNSCSSLVDAKLPMPPSPLLDPSCTLQVEHLLDGYDAFEELIGYR